MESLKEIYQKEIFKQVDYFATWEPSRQIELGDFGILNKYSLQPLGNLNILGFDIRNNNSKEAKATFSYASQGVTSIIDNTTFKGIGNEDNKIRSTLNINFENENSIYLQIDKATNYRIKDILSLKDKLISLNKADKWDYEYVFVSEIIHSDNATILLSKSKNALIQFEIDGNSILPANPSTDIAINSKFSIKQAKDLSLKVIGENNLTPLYKLTRLKKQTLFKRPRFDKRLFDPWPNGKNQDLPFLPEPEQYDTYEFETISSKNS